VLPSPARFISFYGVIWKEIVIVTAIHHCADTPLFHIAGAMGFDGRLLGFGQGGEEESSKYRNNGNYHKQFNQCESGL